MPRPDTVSAGLVGLGTIARTHLEVLAEIDSVSLEFTVDPNVPESTDFRGARPLHYGSVADALAKHEPDLVVIATPTESHVDLVAEVLTGCNARVLVEKPIVHDLAALDRLCAMDGSVRVRGRVFTAHHFAFSPEVRWAADTVGSHPEWGPITEVTAAFYDPYVLRGEQAFASYVSSWMDSGINQLSVLAGMVDLTEVLSGAESDRGASAWYTVGYTSRGVPGVARLRTSWMTGASSKESVFRFGESGIEVWIDHTAMTGFAVRGGDLLASFGSDGRTPRKIAHYRPLYQSLLSDAPDRVLSFDVAERVTRVHHGLPRQVP